MTNGSGVCIINKVAQNAAKKIRSLKIEQQREKHELKFSVEISNNSLEKPSKKTYAKEQAIAWVEIKRTLKDLNSALADLDTII